MGIVDRAKEMASKKKHEFDEGVEKEKRYTAYKHPDADYIVHGQRPYGPKTKAESEEADEFASRKAGEEAKAAERREKVKAVAKAGAEKVVSTAKTVAVKGGNAAVGFVKEMSKPQKGRHPAETAYGHAPRRESAFSGGMGQGLTFGLGGGGKSIKPLGGLGKGFNLGMGSGKGPNPFGGKMKDPLGFGGKRKKQAKFSLF